MYQVLISSVSPLDTGQTAHLFLCLFKFSFFLLHPHDKHLSHLFFFLLKFSQKFIPFCFICLLKTIQKSQTKDSVVKLHDKKFQFRQFLPNCFLKTDKAATYQVQGHIKWHRLFLLIMWGSERQAYRNQRCGREHSIALTSMLFSHYSFVTPWTVCSPPGSSLHGISQVRILERVASPPGDPPHSDQTPVSYTGRRILYRCAAREAPSANGMLLTKPSAVHTHTGAAWAGQCLPDQYQADTEDMIRISEGRGAVGRDMHGH